MAKEFLQNDAGTRSWEEHPDVLDAHTMNLFETLHTGSYYYSNCRGPYTGQAMVADTLYAVPFLVARDMTVDRIAIHVTVLAAGASARLGIYNNSTNLYPGTLVLDCGEVNVAAVGVKAATINQALTKGIYFLAVVSDGIPTIVGTNKDTGTALLILGIDPVNFSTQLMSWAVGHAYGALPDPYTGGAAVTSTVNPRMMLRVASLD